MIDGHRSRSQPVTFRMGFYTPAPAPVSTMTVKPKDSDFAWSNPVTLGKPVR